MVFCGIMDSVRLAGTSCNHLVQHPLLKQGQLEVAQDHVWSEFEHLHRWRLYVAVFDPSLSKKVLPCIQMEFRVV